MTLHTLALPTRSPTWHSGLLQTLSPWLLLRRLVRAFGRLCGCRGWILGLGLLSLGMSTSGAEPKGEPIRIGSVLSVTGPASYLGDPELKTLQLYVDDINRRGGVLGQPVQLIHYDDGSDANKANSFGKRLIEDDKVDILIGGTTTGGTMAMVPLVEKVGIPFISLAGAVVVIEPVKKFVFKTPQTDRMAAEKVFADMKKRGFTKIALLSENSGFGQSGKQESERVADRYGITLVANEVYGPKDTDVSPQLTKIRNTAGVQAVFVFGLGQGPVIVTRNYHQLGLSLPLYQSHGVASDEFLKLTGKAAEGIRLPSPAQLIASRLPEHDPQKAVIQAYEKAYKAAYKTDVSTFGGYAYDALFLAVDALQRAGSTNRQKVRDAIENTRQFVGTSGIFTLSPTDHLGLDLSAFRMLEVKQGEWSLVP